MLSGVFAEVLLLIFQAATVYVVVRRLGFLEKRRFAGWATVGRTGAAALPVLLIPVIILGGIFSGKFTPTESASVAAVVTLFLAFFWYAGVGPRQLPSIVVAAALETGIVMLLLGDSAILARALEINGFGRHLGDFLTGLTDNKYVFLLVVNVLLLAVGIFIEPLPALIILAPFLAPIAGRVRHRPGPLRADHGLQPGAGADPPADRAGALPGLEHRQSPDRAALGDDPALAGGQPEMLLLVLPAERHRLALTVLID